MARTRTETTIGRSALTAERAARLGRMLQLLGSGPQPRSTLMRRLRLDVRGFYRDLEALRKAGIAIRLDRRRYHLDDDPAEALERLPLPDPHLTIGEARQLARGRTAAHRKLREHLDALLP